MESLNNSIKEVVLSALLDPRFEQHLKKLLHAVDAEKQYRTAERPPNRRLYTAEVKQMLGLSADSKTNSSLYYHQQNGLKWKRGRPNTYWLHDVLDYLEKIENQKIER